MEKKPYTSEYSKEALIDNAGQGGGGPRRIGGGRWKRKGRKLRDLKGLEEGEIGGKYATMLNISQSKKGSREKAKKKRG